MNWNRERELAEVLPSVCSASAHFAWPFEQSLRHLRDMVGYGCGWWLLNCTDRSKSRCRRHWRLLWTLQSSDCHWFCVRSGFAHHFDLGLGVPSPSLSTIRRKPRIPPVMIVMVYHQHETLETRFDGLVLDGLVQKHGGRHKNQKLCYLSQPRTCVWFGSLEFSETCSCRVSCQ